MTSKTSSKEKQLEKLIRYHEDKARQAKLSFDRMDNIAHSYTSDRTYDYFLEQKAIVKLLKSLREKIKT